MSDLSATPAQAGIGPDADQQFFYRLTTLATQTDAIEPLLSALAKQLPVSALTISAPEDPSEPPSDAQTQVCVPIRYRGRLLGQLCAEGAPDTDRDDLAARMTFFSPAIALQLGISMRCQDELAAAPRNDFLGHELRDERDRLEAVLDATNDAILLVDTHETLAMATPQFETFTGISRYDILGLPLADLRRRGGGQPSLPPAITNVIRALAGNYTESLGGEFEVAEPQRRTLVWYSLPVYVRSGTLLGRIYAFRDATRERELDRMKTEFISLVSHELRTPLTSVKGFCDLLLEDSAGPHNSESREYLEIIAFNADRLVALINDILDITRIDTDRIELTPEAYPVADAVAEASRLLSGTMQERGHTLSLAIPPDLPLVWADRARLAQVVANLLANALKYTLVPSEIHISATAIHSVEELPAAAPRAQILPCIVISVQDFGIGIAPDEADKVFERFFRSQSGSSSGISGTGLGLAIVKSLVELQGGRVWFKSAPGEGSTFSFSIPLAHAAQLEEF